ncbi:amino acid adenylation domain-containing protein [Streptomyces sp. ISL-10]|uniref:amino acid adenylation domain-containing protein n=1 Tax=Streptomyces sp. ISL-10 TaxID=2819172 RepID=UPI001BE67078|nr:amino acid adenylation domain-containing protein [Streptomyces sp. ISL-10]MBT2364796.1 amino acid adenylation domain-containing protein [Streptomyces sp. ISL-10]
MPNRPSADFRGTVHALVERHGRGTRAEFPAMVHGTRRVSYRELDEMAVRVAAGLRRSGVRDGGFVGVLMPRSPEAVAAMLGVMSTGAAYVPMDPADPRERIAHVIGTAGIEVVVTAETPPPAASAASVLMLSEGCRPVTDGRPVEHAPRPAYASAPSAPAYAIFTSGSTGVPKGAVMTHAALVNLLTWHERARPHSGRQRTAQLCALSFDFSFHEIFSTLCSGGTLVFADEESRRNPFALARFLRDERIERIFAPVPMLEQLARATEESPVELRLRDVVTTGEQLRITGPVRQFFRDVPARLHNHYGATEFQDATTWTATGDPEQWPAIAPIGRPIDGVRVHVVDQGLRELPPGDDGELCIAGAGLSQGYLRQPELTAQRFVPNPFGPGLLYRTGDLARRRPDGVLEHLGRMDTQIKAHGVRIEAGEIETLLLQHPQVADAAVLAHEIDGRRLLVAHVVPCAGLDTGEAPHLLDAFLAPRLPRRMRPEAYAFLSAMPLTASGKTDRCRLRPVDGALHAPLAPELDDGSFLIAFAQARADRRCDLVTALIRRNTMRVLGQTPEPDSDLFSLGLDSLSAILLRQALQDALQCELDQAVVFRYPTVNALAGHVVSLLVNESGSDGEDEG